MLWPSVNSNTPVTRSSTVIEVTKMPGCGKSKGGFVSLKHLRNSSLQTHARKVVPNKSEGGFIAQNMHSRREDTSRYMFKGAPLAIFLKEILKEMQERWTATPSNDGKHITVVELGNNAKSPRRPRSGNVDIQTVNITEDMHTHTSLKLIVGNICRDYRCMVMPPNA